MRIMMLRNDGRVEDLRSRDNLVRVLYLTNKKDGTRPMTYAQCGAVADKVINNGTLEFCNRIFTCEA